jgi:outer membrane protein TolC
MSRTLATLAACLLLGGCVRPPAPPEPVAPLPAAWGVAGDADLSTWARIRDPALADLLAGLDDAREVRAAAARLRGAAALARGASAAAWPTGEDRAGVQRVRNGRWVGAVDQQQDFQSRSVSLGTAASWEIDLWGAVSGAQAMADADHRAAAAGVDAARASVAAEIALALWESRAARRSAARSDAIADRRIATARRSAAAADAGALTAAEAALAKASVAEVLDRADEARRAATAARLRLAALAGQAPEALPADGDGPLPDWTGVPALALPAEVLRRRPDVRAAEAALAAAAAKVGVVEADLYPRLALAGSLGGEGPTLGKALGGEGVSWSFGPTLRWRLLDRARIRAEADAARAGVEEALARYEGTVMGAAAEVGIALSDLAAARAARARSLPALTDSRAAAAELAARHAVGRAARDLADRAAEAAWEQEERADAAALAYLRSGTALLRAIGRGPEAHP